MGIDVAPSKSKGNGFPAKKNGLSGQSGTNVRRCTIERWLSVINVMVLIGMQTSVEYHLISNVLDLMNKGHGFKRRGDSHERQACGTIQ